MVKIFSGAKYGRVEMSASKADMKMILNDRYTGLGTGCFETGAVTVLTLWVRYHERSFGSKNGPMVKTSVLRLYSR